MNTLSIQRPRPSIEMRTPASISTLVKSALVNWPPWARAGDRRNVRQHHGREAGARLRCGTQKQAPGLDIVASLPGDWGSLKAADIANATLERHPDLIAVFCANDDMALGAVEAARGKGKDKVVVIGIDGTQSALKSIRAGRLNATVAQLPYLMGMQAIADAKRVLAGEKLPEFIDVPTLVLTREVIEANTEPMLQYVGSPHDLFKIAR
jgi:ABC-type sugar transport system substrate-binding protein